MCLTTVFCVHLSDHEPYFESRITQFCARLPSMTDSSLTFRVLTYMSSIEPVSFCRKKKTEFHFHTGTGTGTGPSTDTGTVELSTS